MRGLPSEAITWAEDRPAWTQRDEWSALTVESLERWLPLLFFVGTHGKGKPPRLQRIFEHPDRPAATAAAGGGPKRLSISEFEALYKTKGGV